MPQDFRARGIAQLDRRRPVGAFGLDRCADGHSHRSAARKPLVRAQDGAGAANRNGHERNARLDGGDESTHVKRQQARRAREGAFGKKHQRSPAACGARHYARYVDDMVLIHESPQWLNAARSEIEAFIERTLGLRLNPAKTILQPVERGVDFVGHVIKPWRRTIRPRTVNAALSRLSRIGGDNLYTTANSYFGLFRQATRSHTDRARLANLLRQRGRSVDHRLTKSYRPGREAQP